MIDPIRDNSRFNHRPKEIWVQSGEGRGYTRQESTQSRGLEKVPSSLEKPAEAGEDQPLKAK